MKRRWIGVVAALALAGLGTFTLVRYVGGAEARAMEGQEAIEVLVVAEPVPAGTPAEEIGDRVAVETIPASAQVPGSVASVTELRGHVTSVDLVPGEQVTGARFVAPETFEESEEVEVPEGMVEVTVSLSPDRAVGGALLPGNEVAVFASFDPFEATGAFIEQDESGEDGDEAAAVETDAKTPNTTHLIIHKVVVTNVQVETLPTEQEGQDGAQGEESGPELAPTGNPLVTLALEPTQAERLVFTAEFGFVWLGHEDAKASEEGTQVQHRGTIYGDLPSGAGL
jgi:pilus assembly protein CpaB